MPLINTYTTLDDVRRILRAVPPAGRIRFSEAYNLLRKSNDNTGTVELLNIGISNEYADVADYKIQFTDETNFRMYRIDAENMSDILYGIGNVFTDFTDQLGYFLIDSTSWIGVPFVGDIIEFKTNSHISINDGTRFIQDSELFVDSILEKNIRFDSASETDLRFDSTSVPKSVRLAAAKISAYFIFKSIYLEQNFPRSEQNLSVGWLKEGLDLLSSYIGKHNLALVTSAPLLGMYGSNRPVDLDNSASFESSVFNLNIPLNIWMVDDNDYLNTSRAVNLIQSADYKDSVVSDLELIERDYYYG